MGRPPRSKLLLPKDLRRFAQKSGSTVDNRKFSGKLVAIRFSHPFSQEGIVP